MYSRSVLFDLDGTLLDTTQGVLESIRHTFEVLALPIISEEILQRFVGPPIQDSFMKECGMTPAQAQHAADIFRSYYKEEALLKAKPYDGVLTMLDALRGRGYRIAVATYKREDYALKILSHFKILERCDVAHGADNFNILTKANIVDLCIKELGAGSKKEVVLVGDSEYDAIGAQTAGIDFIGVTYGFGFHCTADIAAYPYIFCAESIATLEMFLKDIKAKDRAE